MRIPRGGWILILVVATLVTWRSALALPLAQTGIVSPADITTPTAVGAPASSPILIITATPTSTLPVDSAQHLDQPRTYTVQPGDTLLHVALEIGADLDDMACMIAPDFKREQPLVIGNVLEIPPSSVRCHHVKIGETLQSIAAQYGITPDAIYDLPWNQLNNQPLNAMLLLPELHLRIPLLPAPLNNHRVAKADGPQAFLPFMLSQSIDTSPFAAYAVGGTGNPAPSAQNNLKVPFNWPYGSGHFTWPLYGWLTQEYRYDHRAVDIAANMGTPVTAADRGVVIRAGWNNQGYGLFVVIDHKIDYVTLYAHLSEVLVQEGDVVAQGQVIGKVGSTGNSTGPHLHFEIRDFGRLANPLELLGK
ncbi:MAG: M23 family metallopeptidase [Chloroflexi bacterium]|nr:M23 family metallopeptidase [Chloroflexota bacterium]